MANNIESEYLELNNKKNGWLIYFQTIRSESLNNSHTQSESLKPQNKLLNRYRDVSPYDHSRIVLHKGSTDYINANLIKVEKAKRQYILTQGPLVSTVSHFWLMVWEQDSRAVLMLNKLIEKKQEKCYQYWPSKIGKEHIMKMDDVQLTLEYTEYNDYSYYLTRTLVLTDVDSGESRTIVQFHYTTWPDFGVPSTPGAFLDFLKKIREAGVLEMDVGPPVVHCSAGIGRSGTFCLVDTCLVLIEKFGLNSVNVKDILLEMRQYRMGLIQTADQLKFSYQAIIEGAKRLNNENGDDTENCNVITNGDGSSEELIAEASNSEEDEEEPPPPPPPRNDSLKQQRNGHADAETNGVGKGDGNDGDDEAPNCNFDRPLPNIPKSTSLVDLSYDGSDSEKETYCPKGPLPTVPAGDEDEELELSSEDEASKSTKSEEKPLSPSQLRQRKRTERNEQLAAQVRDMKRRQQSNEQWRQLKRPKTSLPD